MAEPKKQPMRFSEQELGLIKNTFLNNDELLKSIRKFILQMKLNEADKHNLKVFKDSSEAMAVLRKTLLPEIKEDTPLGQVMDLWLSLEFKEKDADQAMNLIKSRELLIKYLDQQLTAISGKVVTSPISFKGLTDLDNTTFGDCRAVYIDLLARNTIITHTEQQLNQLQVLASIEPETLEEVEKKIAKNSSK